MSEEQLEIIRRITDRGFRLAQQKDNHDFLDIFQHLKDELERVVIVEEEDSRM